MIFVLGGVVKRKHEDAVRDLAEAVRLEVANHSIYRCKAIKVEFRSDGRSEDDGQSQFDPRNCPKFIDVSQVKEDELVFCSETEELVETALYTPIEYTQACREANIPLKRGVMLEGPYGTGKTICAYVVAKKCIDNGWTFMYVDDVRDLDRALAMAEQYQPCVVFGEDVDRAVGLDRDSEVDRILNTLDGVDSKNTEIVTVLTTNNVESINKAMMRPGRIDAVVPVRPPDIEAAIRLVRLYGRGMVRGSNDDLSESLLPIIGSNAAVFRELIERSRGAAVRRSGGKVDHLEITASDLARTAKLMRHHLDLLVDKEQVPSRPMAEFGAAVGEQISKALVNATQEIDFCSKEAELTA